MKDINRITQVLKKNLGREPTWNEISEWLNRGPLDYPREHIDLTSLINAMRSFEDNNFKNDCKNIIDKLPFVSLLGNKFINLDVREQVNILSYLRSKISKESFDLNEKIEEKMNILEIPLNKILLNKDFLKLVDIEIFTKNLERELKKRMQIALIPSYSSVPQALFGSSESEKKELEPENLESLETLFLGK